MSAIFREIGQALRSGQVLAVASIISDQGSTPRRSGSRMVVFADGRTVGTIGGGAVEGDVIQRALRRFETGGAEMVPYDLGQLGHAERMDLICGGRIKVLIEHLAANQENIQLFDSALEELRMARPFRWIEIITDDRGQLKVEHAVQNFQNEIIGPLHLKPELQKLLESDQRIPDGARFLEFERHAYVIESITPPPTLFLMGAGHVSQEIGALSQRVGFRTFVFDDRGAFANDERFPEADAIRVCPGYDNVFNGFYPLPDDFIVIVTRGHRFDKAVLAQALKTEAGYIGMIGSRRKREAIYQVLIDQGIAPGALEQVRCPIGLAIDAETPAEIAVSVVAQLIQHRARRRKHA